MAVKKKENIYSKKVLAHWQKNFHRLEKYKNKFGNCEVPYLWGEDLALAKWVQLQRKTKNKLPDNLKEKLLSLGFDFSETPYIWDEQYDQLQKFREKNGHVYLPKNDPQYNDLSEWLSIQVLNKNYLIQERLDKLDALGVIWENKTVRDIKWEAMYNKLVDYYKKYSNSAVPQNWAENPQLSNWVSVQRRTAAAGKLAEERSAKLQKLGFVWSFRDVYDEKWEDSFQLLKEFKKEHGHCKVPGKLQELASWVDRQRTTKNNGKLLKSREKKLNDLGFIWDFKDINEKRWKEKHRLLTTFKKKHGHCFVPVNWKENRSLGNWVATQRRLEAKGTLDPKKKAILEKMGFIWRKEALNELNAIYESQWEDNYKKLKAYKRKHGTCQVSLKIDPKLQRWTSLQRRLQKHDDLSEVRVTKLDKIEFPWDTHQAYWIKMYKELLDFHRQFGHLKVPWGYEKNIHLAPWIQRTRLHKQELSPKKVKLLEAIGFDWARKKRVIIPWEEMYFKLKAFKQKHGHTRVPVLWDKDKKLGKWVSRMRYQEMHLPAERKKLLDNLDFDWGRENVTHEKRRQSLVPA